MLKVTINGEQMKFNKFLSHALADGIEALTKLRDLAAGEFDDIEQNIHIEILDEGQYSLILEHHMGYDQAIDRLTGLEYQHGECQSNG